MKNIAHCLFLPKVYRENVKEKMCKYANTYGETHAAGYSIEHHWTYSITKLVENVH